MKLSDIFLKAVAITMILTNAWCFNASAGWKDLVQQGVQTAVSVAQNQSSNSANEGKSIFPTNESKLESIELNKGMYGVPFNATLQEVRKWCQENNVVIQNTTSQQVEEQARNIIKQTMAIKQRYEIEKWLLPDLEKELAKITTDPTMEALPKLGVAQANAILSTLKNTSFEYNGQNYLLTPVSLGGVITVNDVKKICDDKRITEAVYRLDVAPSSQSANLINENLLSITILFRKMDSGDLKSYSTLAVFENVTGKYQAIVKVLSEKYGTPIFRQDMGAPKELNPYAASITYSSETLEENSLEATAYHALGWSFLGNDALIFKKNIALIADFNNAESMLLMANSFYVLYCEAGAVSQLMNNYNSAMADFSRRVAQDEVSKAAQMKENF